MTNEETDKCAGRFRSFMTGKQEELHKTLMGRCKLLEACTDKCRSEGDMDCINRCGTRYLKDLHGEFETRLKGFNKEIDKMLQ
jgi:hypothetical protein